jgi:hypothetical protein
MFSITLKLYEEASATAGAFFCLGSIRSGQGLGNFPEEGSAATAIVLQDADAGTVGEEIFAEGGVEGRVDTVGHQYEADVAACEKFAGLIGIGGPDGVIAGLLVFVQQTKDDRQYFGILSDDEDVEDGFIGHG